MKIMDIHCSIIKKVHSNNDTEKPNYVVLEKLRMKLENLIKIR